MCVILAREWEAVGGCHSQLEAPHVSCCLTTNSCFVLVVPPACISISHYAFSLIFRVHTCVRISVGFAWLCLLVHAPTRVLACVIPHIRECVPEFVCVLVYMYVLWLRQSVDTEIRVCITPDACDSCFSSLINPGWPRLGPSYPPS